MSGGELAADAPDAPRLTAVLGAPVGVAAARATIACLARQTVADQIELVLVVPGDVSEGDLPKSINSLASCRLVPSGAARTAGAVNAIGARSARAQLVVFCEDHCFPARDWAEGLIEAFELTDRVVVGPVFSNANPETAVGRADFLMGYAPWMEPMESTDAEFLPGHNSCYRRSVLLDQGNRLEQCLDAESVFHERIRASGGRLSVVASARVTHMNFSRPRPWVRLSVEAGRLFAARRARHWSPWLRLLYSFGGPGIAVVRFARTIAECRQRAFRPDAATLVALAVGLCADACGQVIGYVTLAPGQRHDGMDFDRARFITEAERQSRSLRPDGAGFERIDSIERGPASAAPLE